MTKTLKHFQYNHSVNINIETTYWPCTPSHNSCVKFSEPTHFFKTCNVVTGHTTMTRISVEITVCYAMSKEVLISRTTIYSSQRTVDWSEDGRIALATEDKLTIVGVNQVRGPDDIFDKTNVSIISSEALPGPLSVDIVGDDEKISGGSYFSENISTGVLWSPSWLQGCLLAILSSDYNCVIFEEQRQFGSSKWVARYNLFEAMMLYHLKPEQTVLRQHEMDMLKVHCLAWSKSSIVQGFVVGTGSGEIVVYMVGNGGLQRLGSVNVGGCVARIVWLEWSSSESYIAMVLRLGEVKVCLVKFQGTLEIFPVVQVWHLALGIIDICTAKDAVAVHTMKQVAVWRLKENKVFEYQIESYGEKLLVLNYLQDLEILLIDNYVDSASDWLTVLSFDGSGVEKVSGKYLELLRYVNETLAEKKGHHLKILGASLSPEKRTLAIAYDYDQPNVTAYEQISKMLFSLGFVSLSSDLYLNWKKSKGRRENWFIEQAVAGQEPSNQAIVAKFHDRLEKRTEIKFGSSLEQSLELFTTDEDLDLLRYVYVSLRPPKRTAGADSLDAAEIQRQKEQSSEQYDLDQDAYVKYHEITRREISKNLCDLVLKVDVQNVYDKAVQYNLRLFGEKQNMDVFAEFPIGSYSLKFNFNFDQNSDVKTVKSLDGLVWERCDVTLLPLYDTQVQHCEICQSKTIDFHKQIFEGSQLMLALSGLDCIFCGGKLKTG